MFKPHPAHAAGVGNVKRLAVLWLLALTPSALALANDNDIRSLTPLEEPPAAARAIEYRLGPPLSAGPVIVETHFHLRGINEIYDETETFDFEGVLTLTWQDDRQAFDPGEAGLREKVFQGDYQFDEIFTGWYPQIVLVNNSGAYEKQGVILRIRPDGTLTLIESVFATASTHLDLRRYPFDRQHIEAVFEVLGFGADELILQPVAETDRPSNEEIRLPQWTLTDIRMSTRERAVAYAGNIGLASTLVVSMDLERQPLFMLRLVALPLVIIVMLSWSVFWMDRSSIGDRAAVSFVGVLTAVTFQIVIGDVLPRISYISWMYALLTVSFVTMSATVVINLVVASMDKAGHHALGDLIDRRCRWLFPVGYLASILLAFWITFVLL